MTLLLDSGPLDLLLLIVWAVGIACAVGFGLFLRRNGRVAQGIQVTAAVVAVFFACNLADNLWSDWKRKWAHRHELALEKQRRAAAFASLAGHYLLADTMLLKTNHDPFVDTVPPAAVHVHLLLRPDSTYSYRSNIPNDATLDTAGTWKLDQPPYYERYEASFAPINRLGHGIRVAREGNGQVSAQGGYYRNQVYISFKLDLQPRQRSSSTTGLVSRVARAYSR